MATMVAAVMQVAALNSPPETGNTKQLHPVGRGRKLTQSTTYEVLRAPRATLDENGQPLPSVFPSGSTGSTEVTLDLRGRV